MTEVPREVERRATIVDADRSGDVTTIKLRLESGGWPDPVAPASLWTDAEQPVVELHKLLSLDASSATFESYDLETEVPAPGGPYRFQPWWTPEQYAAATDGSIQWRKATFERSGTWDHEHDLLTWAIINDGDEGYVAEPGGDWITVESYERYIRDDALRLRRGTV